MSPQTSDGGAGCFSDLRVGVYKEIVPMGVDPEEVSYRLAGTIPHNTVMSGLWGVDIAFRNRFEYM